MRTIQKCLKTCTRKRKQKKKTDREMEGKEKQQCAMTGI